MLRTKWTNKSKDKLENMKSQHVDLWIWCFASDMDNLTIVSVRRMRSSINRSSVKHWVRKVLQCDNGKQVVFQVDDQLLTSSHTSTNESIWGRGA